MEELQFNSAFSQPTRSLSLLLIDLGSNAWRARLLYIDGDGAVIIKKIRVPQSLGIDTFSGGAIKKETLTDLVSSINEIKSLLKLLPPPYFSYAVATSAIRDSSNAIDVISDVHRETGIKINLISGEEEAHLIHLSTSNWIEKNRSNLFSSERVVIDIGGGSVEVIEASGEAVYRIGSFHIGTRRIKEQILGGGSFQQALKDFKPYQSFLEFLKLIKKNGKPKILIATGGNPGSILEITRGREVIPLSDLNELKKRIYSLGSEERIKAAFPELEENRAGVILPAAVILEDTGEILKTSEILVPEECGLSHGVKVRIEKEVCPYLLKEGGDNLNTSLMQKYFPS